MPLEAPSPEEMEKRAAESILGDPGIRDEMTDAEARPLIDWGLSQVAALVARAQYYATPELLDDPVGDLRKLMKRINRLIGHRTQGDEDRVRKGLERLAVLSERVYGEAAPKVAPGDLDRLYEEMKALSNEQVVQKLVQVFAPPMPPPPELSAPPERDQLSAPPRRDELAAPPQYDQLTGPPDRERLAGPQQPDLLTQGGDDESQ